MSVTGWILFSAVMIFYTLVVHYMGWKSGLKAGCDLWEKAIRERFGK